MTRLPSDEEYIKSDAEYYYHYINSFYTKTNIPVDYCSYITQETIRYGVSDSEQGYDYERFYETVSKFREVNDFFETTSSSDLTKKIYTDVEYYNDANSSYKNQTEDVVFSDISHFIESRLNVEFIDGEIILPEASYFNNLDIRTENDIAYFQIEKNDGKTSGKDTRYSINGTINLKTQALSYNEKGGNYVDGELRSYADFDYDLTVTNQPIDIEFDTNGEFKESYIKPLKSKEQ